MLGKIRRYYRDNKANVWKIVAIIVFIFIAIRLLNYLSGFKLENIQNSNSSNNNVTTTNSNTTASLPSEAIISGSSLSKEEVNEDIGVIEDFINKCNSQKVNEAYELLSTDCKEQIFPNVESFYSQYYKKIFTEKRSYEAEAWMDYFDITYKINLMSDILATGKVSEESFEDYYTIVEENDEKKINLMNFVRTKEINEQEEEQNIKINILNTNTYIDYEEYEIKVTNKNDFSIKLDTKESTKTVYVVDENSVQYTWRSNEIDTKRLTLEPNESKTFKIKFNKMYNGNRITNKICFTNIVMEYGNENKSIDISIKI